MSFIIFLCFPGKALVGMAEVEAAIQAMFQAPHIQVMKSSTKLSKIFLVAMVYELYQTGMVETTFEKVNFSIFPKKKLLQSCLLIFVSDCFMPLYRQWRKVPWMRHTLESWLHSQWISSFGCLKNQIRIISSNNIVIICCKLGECRIILCEAGAKHRLQKLQLNFPSDDVAFALKDDKELPWLAKYL
ncbi:hypothetical protein AAG906_018964 [Vitis piasezkii]